MTNTLHTRVRSLAERLLELENIAVNADENGRIINLLAELKPPATNLQNALSQKKVLIDAGLNIAEPANLESARSNAENLLTKFASDSQASTLTRRDGWPRLIESLKNAATAINASATASWKSYRNGIFTGDTPVVIRGRIAGTPQNNEAFKVYEALHRQLNEAFSNLPSDRLAIENARTIAAKLLKVVKDFDFDVPSDVKKFLDAIQGGGASLELLNSNVRDWLETNNALPTYPIVPRQ